MDILRIHLFLPYSQDFDSSKSTSFRDPKIENKNVLETVDNSDILSLPELNVTLRSLGNSKFIDGNKILILFLSLYVDCVCRGNE